MNTNLPSNKPFLFHGDCRDYMGGVSDETFDAIITDAPYNVSKVGSKIARGKGTKYKGTDIKLDFGVWDRNEIHWIEYIDEFVRLLKPCGVLVLFYDKLWLGTIGMYLQDEFGFQVRHIGNWIKSNPAPQARKVKWQNGAESFLVATKNKGEGHHFNYKLGQSPDYFMTSVSYEHEHPNQKPIELMEWIVKYWTFEGDLVLDSFAGVFTTGVACVRTGRNFVGCEKEDNYFKIGERKIKDSAQQLDLFLPNRIGNP